MPEQKQQENKHTDLSVQSYQSRPQLMLYSGLFFVYEFIGVKVPPKPLPNIEIEFLSTQAVPIVLLLLVIYFLYRTLLGWQISNKEFKEMKVSSWDFNPSIGVAAISILLFVYQSITKIQIADYITESESVIYTLGLVIIDLMVITFSVNYYAYHRKADVKENKALRILLPIFIILTFIGNIFQILSGFIIPTLFLITLIGGMMIIFLIRYRTFLTKRNG